MAEPTEDGLDIQIFWTQFARKFLGADRGGDGRATKWTQRVRGGKRPSVGILHGVDEHRPLAATAHLSFKSNQLWQFCLHLLTNRSCKKSYFVVSVFPLQW